MPVSLPATIDGDEAEVINISFGGFSFHAKDADLEEGDDITAVIDLGDGKLLELEALVVRCDGDDRYGAAFAELSPEAFWAIEDLQFRHSRRSPPGPRYRRRASSGGV